MIVAVVAVAVVQAFVVLDPRSPSHGTQVPAALQIGVVEDAEAFHAAHCTRRASSAQPS